MTTYIPLTGIKRKESDPALWSVDDPNTSRATGSGQVVTEDSVEGNTEGVRPEGGHLKSVGIFRLAAILFFMGYGGSYGVEGKKRYV